MKGVFVTSSSRLFHKDLSEGKICFIFQIHKISLLIYPYIDNKIALSYLLQEVVELKLYKKLYLVGQDHPIHSRAL